MTKEPGITDSRSTMIALGALTVAAAALVVPAIVRRGDDSPRANGSGRQRPSQSGHEEINGITYYYEIHGHGEPMFLFHGGLGSIEMFGPVLPMLGQEREVIAVDLHGHGRTSLGERAINVNEMADDMAVLMDRFEIEQLDALGYSLGGEVALRLGIQHPQKVRRLVLVSTGFSRDGVFPEIVSMLEHLNASMADSMKDTPMYLAYSAIAPNPGDFPELLNRMGEWLRFPYNWRDDVGRLTMPVMLVFGDSDMFRPEHVVQFYQLLGGALKDAGWTREYMSPNRLAILPGLTHYDIPFSPRLASTVLPFLRGEIASRNWLDLVRGIKSRH